MYRFDWADLIQEDLREELSRFQGDGRPFHPALLGPLVSILRASGGVPLARSDWSGPHRSAVARRLLHEAVSGFLWRSAGFTGARRGVILRREGGGRSVVESHTRVNVNHATQTALVALPGIGSALADRIVEARRRSGPFRSPEELSERVHRLGAATVSRLDGLLDLLPFAPGRRTPEDDTLEADLRAFLAYTRPGHAPDLAGSLEVLAVFVADHPHPATRLGLKREELEPATPSVEGSHRDPSDSPDEASDPWGGVAAGALHLLLDTEYYVALPSLLEEATDEVDVCMFFVALGGATHPTRHLLDVLTAKAAEGCQVRVLLDRDDEGDPYGSSVVNEPAARYLSERGVQVRWDQPRVLLHAKFVVIDRAAAVIGSHNWTAGSFFTYRDLSVVVRGETATALWKSRFEELWAEGQPLD